MFWYGGVHAAIAQGQVRETFDHDDYSETDESFSDAQSTDVETEYQVNSWGADISEHADETLKVTRWLAGAENIYT